MKIQITSKFPEMKYNGELEICCESTDIFMEDCRQKILENLEDELLDLYIELFAECDVKPCGFFNEKQAHDHLYHHVKNKLVKNRGAWIIECMACNASFQIDIADYLLNRLNEDADTGEFDVHVGQYVEKCLLLFVDRSSWHIEKDMMWYGIDGEQPLPIWSINKQTTLENLHFWFVADSWSVMRYLGDFSDGFLIWYTAECDYYTPNIDAIRNECPIVFEATNCIDDIFDKVSLYLKKQ